VDVVAVHDAVRPFVNPETIDQVIEQAARTGAAIVGIVPVDTVKQMQRHTVRGTLNRERLVLAQTRRSFKPPYCARRLRRLARTASLEPTSPVSSND